MPFSLCVRSAPKKTPIIHGAMLSYHQLRRYLTLLSSKDFIQQDEDGRYNITPAGHQMLKPVSRSISTLRRLRRELMLDPVVNGD